LEVAGPIHLGQVECIAKKQSRLSSHATARQVHNQNGTVTVAKLPSITLKNIPTDLHRKLKKRAEEHHRSLNREIIATLKTAADAPRGFDAADLEASVRRARALFRRPVTEREINAWKRAGRM